MKKPRYSPVARVGLFLLLGWIGTATLAAGIGDLMRSVNHGAGWGTMFGVALCGVGGVMLFGGVRLLVRGR